MVLAKLKIVVKRREVGIWLLKSMVLSNRKMPFLLLESLLGKYTTPI